MKKSLFKVTMFAALTAAFVACKDDSKDEVEDFHNENTLGLPESVSSDDNAVDLGLTSGTKWAKMNIGAKNPWNSGDYFAWGETKSKAIYKWDNYLLNTAGEANFLGIKKYQLNDGSNGIWYSNVKFIGDNKTTLDPEDDAAHTNWGGDWVMPTPSDFQELCANCSLGRTNDYKGTGVAGFVLMSKENGNEVFFPFAGFKYYDLTLNAESVGPLWTNELSNFSSSGIHIWTLDRDLTNYDFKNDGWGRWVGAEVRAVCKAGGNTNGHEAVDLGLPSGKLWASMNVGAEKPEESGYYLGWGETEPKEYFSDSTYKFSVKTDMGFYSYNKYQVEDGNVGDVWYTKDFVGDGKTELEDVDDAAVANWGGKWKMPTKEQLEELKNECYWQYTENYADTTNVSGIIVYKAKAVTDKGKKVTRTDLHLADGQKPLEGYTLADIHIFMPAAGYKEADENNSEGFDGFYWTSTLADRTYSAYHLRVNDPRGSYINSRYVGMPIRPVCK